MDPRARGRTAAAGRWALGVSPLAALAVALSVGLAVGAPGDLDASFDADGKRTIDYGSNDSAQAVALQPDGKILLAGFGGSTTAMTVTRLNPNGSDDMSFDGDGTSSVDLGGDDRAYALALQPDGKIVIVGETSPVIGFGPDIAVARLNPNGSPDASFNGTGARVIDYGLTFDRGRAVAIQPDGKILVAGFGGPDTAMKVTRLNPGGSDDTSFGTGGTSSVDLGVIERANGLALQPDGKIVVVGQRSPVATPSSGDDVAVARLTPKGAPDGEFGLNGTRTIDVAGGGDDGRAVTLQPDGRIVVAGAATSLGGRDMAVVRLNPDGSNDNSFGEGGRAGLDFGAADEADAVALQPNGKIVVAGATGLTNVAIGRLQPGGLPDATFDFDGRRTVNFGGDEQGHGMALQPNGRIVVAGETGLGDDVVIARLEGDPPPAGAGGGPGAGPGGPGGGRAVPRCAGKRATIVGTSRRDVLRGTARADVIVALGGNDLVRAGRGADLVCGGTGRDRLLGQAGADRLLGGLGPDRLEGGPGADRLFGQGGADRLLGGAALDDCRGGPGPDHAACEIRRSAA